jgi:hypothetical protein
MTAANSKTGPPCLASRLIVALHLRLIVPRLAPGSRLWLIRDSYAAQTAVLRISAARPGGIVISQSVTSPVSGSAATCPRNPSRRLDLDLRVWRA